MCKPRHKNNLLEKNHNLGIANKSSENVAMFQVFENNSNKSKLHS